MLAMAGGVVDPAKFLIQFDHHAKFGYRALCSHVGGSRNLGDPGDRTLKMGAWQTR